MAVVAGSAWLAEVLAKGVLLRGGPHPFDLVDGTGAHALVIDRDGRVSGECRPLRPPRRTDAARPRPVGCARGGLVSEHLWWYVARSGGIVAWALLAASVLWGLALSTKALGKRPHPNWLLDLHRFLGGLALVFTGVHVGALVLDSYLSFGLMQLLVPFTSSYRPGGGGVGSRRPVPPAGRRGDVPARAVGSPSTSGVGCTWPASGSSP